VIVEYRTDAANGGRQLGRKIEAARCQHKNVLGLSDLVPEVVDRFETVGCPQDVEAIEPSVPLAPNESGDGTVANSAYQTPSIMHHGNYGKIGNPGNPGNAANPGNPGNRGRRGSPYKDVFDKLLSAGRSFAGSRSTALAEVTSPASAVNAEILACHIDKGLSRDGLDLLVEVIEFLEAGKRAAFRVPHGLAHRVVDTFHPLG
jgi:hypothetical protein